MCDVSNTSCNQINCARNEHVIRYNVPELGKLKDGIRIMCGNKFTRVNHSEGDRNYPAFSKTADRV